MTLSPLPRLIVEPLVRNALLEDLGLAGDITSTAVIPAEHRSVVVMAAREPGVIAGLDAAELAFQLVDPTIAMKRHIADGAAVASDDIIA
ncbi:carboxylating nicotinate-nucleotide diphosphorylase, partial [Rhizobium sp. BR5]